MDFMNEALKEGKKGIKNGDGGPFGAVVVKHGKIIGRGHNCVLKNNDPTAHGEISAIRDACKNIGSYDLSGAELYTTCYPCPMCMGAVLWARLSKVYYACGGDDAAKLGFDDNDFYEFFKDKKRQDKLLIYDGAKFEDCAEFMRGYKDKIY